MRWERGICGPRIRSRARSRSSGYARVTKGPSSKTAALAMAYKLLATARVGHKDSTTTRGSSLDAETHLCWPGSDWAGDKLVRPVHEPVSADPAGEPDAVEAALPGDEDSAPKRLEEATGPRATHAARRHAASTGGPSAERLFLDGEAHGTGTRKRELDQAAVCWRVVGQGRPRRSRRERRWRERQRSQTMPRGRRSDDRERTCCRMGIPVSCVIHRPHRENVGARP
jgi:hypothetical protein